MHTQADEQVAAEDSDALVQPPDGLTMTSEHQTEGSMTATELSTGEARTNVHAWARMILISLVPSARHAQGAAQQT